jgi:Hr1 repeat
MADPDSAIADIYKKIEREKALINAANHMRQSTNNLAVQARVDSNVRDGRRNIGYLEEKLQELQLRRIGGDGAPPPPAHGGDPYQVSSGRQGRPGPQGGPTPPPKDAYGGRADYGAPGPGGYGQGTSTMPLTSYNAPHPKARPNFSKLGRMLAASQLFQYILTRV